MEYFEYARLKIKNLRRRKRLKQSKIANLLGMSFRKYNLIERGKITLNYILLIKIIGALDISINEFTKTPSIK